MDFKVKNNISAITKTLLVFLILFLILFFIKLYTPIPPYPEGGGGQGIGIEINIGTDEPQVQELDEPLAIPEPVKEEKEEDQLLTSEDKESEPVKPIVEKKNIVKKKANVEEPPKKSEPKEVKPVVNQRALYSGKKSSITSEELLEKGSPNGSPNSNNYQGGGTGQGTGNEGGTGSGSGTGTGNGISYSLEGRTPQFIPIPEYNSQSEGKVAVRIVVDPEGRVISAIPGVKGSTTLDDYLMGVAKAAALKARFSRKIDSPGNQEGTIVYKFVLQ